MIETTQQTENPQWYQSSILIKLSIITVIVLLLLIPSAWIQDLITERANTQQAVANGVYDKWSGSQLIQGPVLVIPYKKIVPETNDHQKDVNRQIIEYLYLLPENLQIKADVKTEKFHRGIVDITGYSSKILVRGSFDKSTINKLGINADQIINDKIRLVFSISDLKGLKNNPVVKLQSQELSPEPVYDDKTPFDKGLQVSFVLPKEDNFDFSYTLDLKGSNEINFLNTGKVTDIEVKSDWQSPSFTGRFLPDAPGLTQNGFTAKWHMLAFNRPFPQQWVNDDTLLTSKKAMEEAVVGIKLHLAVDQYRETTRTAKYGILVIVLTFVSLFLTEVIRKQSIHVFNYTLIGAAMIVYYTLLLSFSEHVGFDWAYLIASASTIALISWFTSSLLHNKGVAILFAAILSTFYGFIFVLVQLEELSLLIGSIALFIIVALLMYFSRKINWDKH